MLSVQLSALDYLGMIPGDKVLKGFWKALDFYDFFGMGVKMQKNMKMHEEHGWILVSGALDPRKIIPKQIPKKHPGGFSSKNQKKNGNIKTTSKMFSPNFVRVFPSASGQTARGHMSGRTRTCGTRDRG